MGEKLLTPGDLKGIAEKVHLAKVQEQFDRVRKEQEEQRAIHEAFMSRDVHPQVMDRLNTTHGRDTVTLALSGRKPRWRMRAERRSPRYTTDWDELLRVA
jgi:hypothetical protein